MASMASPCDCALSEPRIVRFGGLLKFVGGGRGRLTMLLIEMTMAVDDAVYGFSVRLRFEWAKNCSIWRSVGIRRGDPWKVDDC